MAAAIVFYLGFKNEFTELGEFGIYLALITFLSALFTLGRHIGLRRYFAEIDELERPHFVSTIFFFTFLTSSIFLTLTFFSFNILNTTYDIERQPVWSIIFLISFFAASNQPLINAILISKQFKRALISLLFSFSLSIIIFFVLLIIDQQSIIISFLVGKLFFEWVHFFLNVVIAGYSKLLIFSFKQKFLKITSPFSNSLTPELILFQGFNLLERFLVKLLFSSETLGVLVLLSNIFSPVKILVQSLKGGLNNYAFDDGVINTRDKKIVDSLKVYSKYFICLMAMYLLIVLMVNNYFDIFYILNSLIFSYALFTTLWGLCGLLTVRFIALCPPKFIFLMSIFEIPLILSYYYFGSFFVQDQSILYFLFVTQVPKLILMQIFIRFFK